MAEWEPAVEAHLLNTRDILATKTSEQHWNATICAVAIRLSTVCLLAKTKNTNVRLADSKRS
jgi:hypothetical protein